MSKSKVVCPQTLVNIVDGVTHIYTRHEELGHGGFATVFRVTDQANGEDYAMKVVPKARVSKPKSLEKMKSEIKIQSSLNHVNVVKAYGSFEDEINYYIIIELCPGHSIRDIIKKEGFLKEDVVVQYTRDVLEGLSYLHDNRIIHRDLKIENFLFGSDGKIKIADFGLSAQLDYDNEKKFTVCGTPNYISPELLTQAFKGHSYEVDIWAIGVCVFAMLYGTPPFETAKTKETYEQIKHCQYKFPCYPIVSDEAKDFIQSTLKLDPKERPNCQELLAHPFITGGKLLVKKEEKPMPRPEIVKEENIDINARIPKSPAASPSPYSTMPNQFVSRFCDHSAKYGLGYLLIDGSVGACFNDLSRMIMDPYQEFIQYWPDYSTEIPEVLSINDPKQAKKTTILQKFSDSLRKSSTMFTLPEEKYDRTKPMHHVKYWIRNDDATLFRLDNRNVQVNFTDRTKVALFWNIKKLMIVHSIKESGRLVNLHDLNDGSHSEEKKRFAVVKHLLTELSSQ